MTTLVSIKKRFVFIHLPKCAGTSVTTLLEPYSYPWLLSSKVVRNSLTVLCRWSKVDLFGFTGRYILPMHADAAALVRRFPDIDFSSYYRFTIVRSPWSRLVSNYEFHRRPSRRYADPERFSQFHDISFNQFVRIHCSQQSVNLVDRLFKHRDGTLDMDYVAKQESLDSDMKHILTCLGIPGRSVPHRNATRHHDYRSYYDDQTIQLVGNAFERDIQAFGYSFGD